VTATLDLSAKVDSAMTHHFPQTLDYATQYRVIALYRVFHDFRA